MKNLILLIALLTLLINCRNRRGVERPELARQEQKSPYFAVISFNGRNYIDIDKSYCLSRVYEISDSHIGSTSDVIKLPIAECHKIIGYSPSEYGVLTSWLVNMKGWLKGF